MSKRAPDARYRVRDRGRYGQNSADRVLLLSKAFRPRPVASVDPEFGIVPGRRPAASRDFRAHGRAIPADGSGRCRQRSGIPRIVDSEPSGPGDGAARDSTDHRLGCGARTAFSTAKPYPAVDMPRPLPPGTRGPHRFVRVTLDRTDTAGSSRRQPQTTQGPARARSSCATPPDARGDHLSPGSIAAAHRLPVRTGSAGRCGRSGAGRRRAQRRRRLCG